LKNRIENLKVLKPYLGKFSLVGISGIIVNQGLLTLFVSVWDWQVSVAGIVAIELSILSNFFLNNFWTWKNQKKNSFLGRFLKYHAVTVISGGMNYLILVLLTHFGLHYFIANLIGIGFGTVINFIFNHFWTFKAEQESRMHKTKITVRGYHLDMYQHVNNARYLEFLEEARWQYVDSVLNLEDFMNKGLGFAVVNININYRKPARFNQVLEISSHMAAINRGSGTIHQEITIENTKTKIADADVTFVIVDIKSARSVPFTGEILQIMEKF
jgi:thioesterase-3